jgi:3-deoxy-D-manno-octulosonic-acid transferase
MDSGALNIVHNAQQIEDWIGCWLRDESKCKLAGEAAHQVIQDNQGALDKTIGCLMTFLSEK